MSKLHYGPSRTVSSETIDGSRYTGRCRHCHNIPIGLKLIEGQAHDGRSADDMAPHLVSNALDLLIDGESGLWHLTNGDAVSWAEFARLVAITCSFSPDRIRGVPHEELDLRALRPHRVPLASVRGALMPPLGNAIGEFAAQARQSGLLDARQPINE